MLRIGLFYGCAVIEIDGALVIQLGGDASGAASTRIDIDGAGIGQGAACYNQVDSKTRVLGVHSDAAGIGEAVGRCQDGAATAAVPQD